MSPQQPPQHPPTDLILSISSPNVQAILCREKTIYEFASKRTTGAPLPPSIKRVWFYVTAPESSVSYICEVGIGITAPVKVKGKKTSESDGIVSLPITSFYRLHQPLALSTLKQRFGLKAAPRGGMALPVPTSLLEAVTWQMQQLIWALPTQTPTPAAASVVSKQAGKKPQMKRKASEVMDLDGGEETEVEATRPRMIKRWRSLRVASRNSSMATVIMKNPSYDAMDVD